MMNPIIQRELFGLLRTRNALLLQWAAAILFSAVVVLRWPTGALVDLSGAQSQQVFRAFAYGLLAGLILLAPIYPATSIVREKNKGTLVLLLNSPMKSWSIYLGKLGGVLGFAALLIVMSTPAAAACYAMGGISLAGDLLPLYGLFAMVVVQYVAVGLLVSSFAGTTDSALRLTYASILFLAVVSLGPHLFLQGQSGALALAADWLRCVSPLPALMEILGQSDLGGRGLMSATGLFARFALLWLVVTSALMLVTVLRLNHRIFDRSRSQGVITNERSWFVRLLRRLVFIVDPQRRKAGVPPLVNPVMVKEFRCRRFGRSHWMLRLIALCALGSLGLMYASTTGTMNWGVETIGGLMVVLQVALIVLITPSLAAGLISTERESGGWQLLQMTPMSSGRIVRGKLMSVIWPTLLILLATLPGYIVMYFIEPSMALQIRRVVVCLLITAGFAITLSAAVSGLCRRTAAATTISYAALLAVCAGTMLFWIGRDAPFGHATVQAALAINPMAAALAVIETPGFTQYELIPVNWWFAGGASFVFMTVLAVQTWRLTRPQ